MNKLFPGDSKQRKSLIEFLDKKGFYIILIVLIVVVGTTAVVLSTRNLGPSYSGPNDDYVPDKIVADQDGPSDYDDTISATNSWINSDEPDEAQAAGDMDEGDSVKDVPDEDKITAVTTATTTAAEAEAVALADAETDVNAAASDTVTAGKTGPASSPAPEPQSFIMPVFGQITQEYAMNRLVYSKTLEEWRTHSGIDIASERGTPVKAVADGTVLVIKKDPRYGITVIIEHEGGMTSVYCNLASDEVVVPNQKVKQGEVIGSVGNTAAFEIAEQSHLHFEVMKDGELVDPALYLPLLPEESS